jgi:hypothetical protein
MNNIETLGEFGCFFEIPKRAGAAASFKIGGVWAAGTGCEYYCTVCVVLFLCGVYGPKPNVRRRGSQGSLDNVAADKHHFVLDPRSGSRENLAGFG